MIAGSAYAVFGVKAYPGTLPAAAAAGALAEAVFVLTAMDLAALFLVFPTGRLPSPRWRPAALAGLVLTGLTLAAFVVSTRRVALPAPGGISLTYPNPLAVRPSARSPGSAPRAAWPQCSRCCWRRAGVAAAPHAAAASGCASR